MALAKLAVTRGAKRCVLARHPVAVGVPIHRVAPIAEAARDKSAVDAGAIEGLCVAEGQDLHLRGLLGSLHGPRSAPREGAGWGGADRHLVCVSVCVSNI